MARNDAEYIRLNKTSETGVIKQTRNSFTRNVNNLTNRCMHKKIKETTDQKACSFVGCTNSNGNKHNEKEKYYIRLNSYSMTTQEHNIQYIKACNMLKTLKNLGIDKIIKVINKIYVSGEILNEQGNTPRRESNALYCNTYDKWSCNHESAD